MALLVADRVDRPPTLFDFVEDTPAAPAREPTREQQAPGQEPAAEPSRVPAHAPRRDAVEQDVAAGGVVHEHGGVGGEPTLDDMVVGAWEGLTAQAAVACPLCEGTLQPLYGGSGGADPVVAGRCDSCGTMLA